jgi:hypothetical protein
MNKVFHLEDEVEETKLLLLPQYQLSFTFCTAFPYSFRYLLLPAFSNCNISFPKFFSFAFRITLNEQKVSSWSPTYLPSRFLINPLNAACKTRAHLAGTSNRQHLCPRKKSPRIIILRDFLLHFPDFQRKIPHLWSNVCSCSIFCHQNKIPNTPIPIHNQ